MNKFDWENCKQDDIQKLELSVPGWKDLTIEYIYCLHNFTSKDICWRVSGTEHTFVTHESDLRKVESPETFFREFLINFRTEVIDWAKVINFGYGQQWMYEYVTMYKDYIL